MFKVGNLVRRDLDKEDRYYIIEVITGTDECLDDDQLFKGIIIESTFPSAYPVGKNGLWSAEYYYLVEDQYAQLHSALDKLELCLK